VAPYINGRIFDRATESWAADAALSHAAKQLPAGGPRFPPPGPDGLDTYDESYGSKAEFSVMCPHTQYWQDTIAGVAGELVHRLKTDGVYIDQVQGVGALSV
jgi:hypothetical protein